MNSKIGLFLSLPLLLAAYGGAPAHAAAPLVAAGKTFYCNVHAASGDRLQSSQRSDGLYTVTAATVDEAEKAAEAAAQKEHNEAPDGAECGADPSYFDHHAAVQPDRKTRSDTPRVSRAP